MAELYTYAVARIRAKELGLLSANDVEQLVSAADKAEVLRLLADKGYETNGDTESILARESEKTRELMRELAGDLEPFSVFTAEKDYHNLKAAIKAVYAGVGTDGVFLDGGSVPTDDIRLSAVNRDFSLLPEHMRAAAEEAAVILNKTGDGQLCDVIIDKAALEEIRRRGRASGSTMLDEYSELFVALTDVKIALRSARLGKSREFSARAVAKCDTLDCEKLALAAAVGEEELFSYLSLTKYACLEEAAKVSFSEFEKQCDNLIMTFVKGQKSNPFTIGPLAAYLLARENELKIVRIILSAKENGLASDSVRERLRDMYV